MDIKNEEFVLLDTCSYSNLMNGKWSKTEQKACLKLLSGGNKPVISDLTFVELVCGSRNLSEFNKLINDMKNGFILFGHQKNLKNITEYSYSKNIKNNNDLQEYKKRLLIERNKIIKPIFCLMAFSYLRLFCIVLSLVSDLFRGKLIQMTNGICASGEPAFVTLLDEIFDGYINKEFESENLFYELAVNMMTIYLKNNDKSFTDENIKKEIDKLKLPKNLTKLTSKFVKIFKASSSNSKSVKNMKTLNNIELLLEFMGNQRRSIANKEQKGNKESELEMIAIDFCVINSGFCSGKFDFNDLVDIYNFAIIGNDENHFYYYTNEKKWQRFKDIISHKYSDLING